MKMVARRAKSYLPPRQQQLRATMAKDKLDGILLTHPPDLAYLTDFTGDDSIGLITAKDFFLATDFRYKEQAALEAPWLKIRLRTGKMSETLADALIKAKIKRIGFESNFTTFGEIDALRKALKAKSAKIELIPLNDVMVNLRKVKDQHEIQIIRQSIEIAESAYKAIRRHLKIGQTENQLAGRLIFEMRSRGASGTSFPPIIAAGSTSSLPHYRPADRPVRKNQPLLFDWGAVFNGYCSDLTRTLLIGKVSTRMRKIYQVTLEAQMTAIQFLRPGVTTRQADAAARKVIEKAGFGKYFGHGLGHGIGRDIHELPYMRKTSGDEQLSPGMVVTVEPGIYLPGEGGVRIEDDVLITANGREVLSSLDKTLASAVVD
jgi:Xaa-Pro aminopeptidase